MNIEALEQEHGPAVVQHLSRALHMPGLALEEMCAASAAFDLVPYGEATRRGCIALRTPELDALGFDADIRDRMRELSAEPYGMLLVTGPTGSGKTTSLYATITEVNKGLDKIITIEDPVEYQLPGVLQIPVNEQKGLTFARGLRSILRHVPRNRLSRPQGDRRAPGADR